MLDQLKELLEMQRMLDENIVKKHNAEITIEKLRIAMLDEIGELTHELKGDWCWWKTTQAPVNREKVLEELVDVWHFALSIANHTDHKLNENISKYDYKDYVKNDKYTEIVSHLITREDLIVFTVMCLTYKLGFEFDDVYEAYKKKNAVNYERLRNGY